MKKNKGFQLFRMIASVSKKNFIQCYILGILDGVLSAVVLVLLSVFFNSLTDYMQNNKAFGVVAVSFIGLFLVKIVCEMVNGYSNYCGERYYYMTIRKITDTINAKCANIAAIEFEKPLFLDDLSKAYAGIGIARNFVNSILTAFLLYLPYFLIITVYLYLNEPMLVAIILFVFLSMLAGQLLKSKISIDVEEKVAPYNRRASEYEACLVHKDYVKDTRTLSARSYFMRLFTEALDQVYQIKKRAKKDQNRINIIVRSLNATGYILSILIMFYSLIQNKIPIGVFASLFYALDNLFTMMEDVIGDCLSYSAEEAGKIKHMIEFLNREEEECKEETLLEHNDIEVKNISFAYPDGDEVLHDLSFNIKRGETIAIVGRNGSGKSTLLRLLVGMYQPQKGLVSHDSKDLLGCSKESRYRGISAVFQKFNRYPMTVGENITISDGLSTEGVKGRLNEKEFVYDFERFPEKEATLLGREYGGEELSGGQWQKLAIARGVYRTHEMICLDEPTAAIDPLEENELYHQFAKVCKENTAVIVTHRMGPVKLADRILVLDKGRIVGYSNHADLLKSCEEYQNLWESQSEVYAD